MKYLTISLILFLTSCATNEHDAAIEVARYTALENINTKLNEPDIYDCEASCTITIASRNKTVFTAQMLQEFGAIDRLIAGGVSITEIIARGVFNPATLQAYAMYKGLEVVAENGGTRINNTNSGNTETLTDVDNDKSQVLTDVNNDKSSIVQTDFDNDKSQVTTDSHDSTVDSNDNNSTVDSNDNNSTVPIETITPADVSDGTVVETIQE